MSKKTLYKLKVKENEDVSLSVSKLMDILDEALNKAIKEGIIEEFQVQDSSGNRMIGFYGFL